MGNVRQARDRLRHLLQTKSVARYTTEFRSLILQIPDASAAEQLDKFIAGFKPIFRREVEMRKPDTLLEAMRLADRADQHIYRNTASGVTRPQGPAPSSPVPMDIGAIDTRGYKAPLARVTPQERDRLAREDRCFRCRAKGHRASACKGLSKIPALIATGTPVGATSSSQEATKGIAQATLRTLAPCSSSYECLQEPLQPTKVGEATQKLGRANTKSSSLSPAGASTQNTPKCAAVTVVSLKNSAHSEEVTPFRECRGSAERREGP